MSATRPATRLRWLIVAVVVGALLGVGLMAPGGPPHQLWYCYGSERCLGPRGESPVGPVIEGFEVTVREAVGVMTLHRRRHTDPRATMGVILDRALDYAGVPQQYEFVETGRRVARDGAEWVEFSLAAIWRPVDDSVEVIDSGAGGSDAGGPGERQSAR